MNPGPLSFAWNGLPPDAPTWGPTYERMLRDHHIARLARDHQIRR